MPPAQKMASLGSGINLIRPKTNSRNGLFSITGKIGALQRAKLDIIDTLFRFSPTSPKLERWRESTINLGLDIVRIKEQHKEALTTNGKIPKTKTEISTLLTNFRSLIWITQLLVSRIELENVFEATLTGVKELDYKRGFLYTYDSKTGLLQIQSAINPEDLRDSRFANPTNPSEVNDTAKAETIRTKTIKIVEKRVKNRPPEIIIPLVVEGEVVGLLKVDNNEEAPLFKPGVNRKTILDSLKTFANLSGAAIRNASTIKDLKETRLRFAKAVNYARLRDIAMLAGHNIRNPLAGIRGIMETIGIQQSSTQRKIKNDLEGLNPEELTPEKMQSLMQTWVEEMIEKFQDRYTLLQDAVDQLNQLEILLEPFCSEAVDHGVFDLNAVIADAAKTAKKLAATNNVSINLPGLSNEPIEILVSEEFKLALFHIFKNSIEAIGVIRAKNPDFSGGRIDVSVSTENRRAKIIIIDDGIGITEEHMERIFEPFFFSEDDKHFTNNFGMGLSFAREAIQRIKGEISVSSVRSEGTRVEIEIPTIP
jgi:signal transduction histidine kinase